MPRLRSVALLLAMLSLGACAGPHTLDPYPVTNNGPNPGPLPGYRVRCNTVPGSTEVMLRSSTTACRQEYGPAPGYALRARG